MCSGCSVNKLNLLPKQEQVLLPNLLDLLVVLGYHNEETRKQETLNLIAFLHGELSNSSDSFHGSILGKHLKAEGKESLTAEIRKIQAAVYKETGVATKDLGGFLYMIQDKRLWAYPAWVLIHWAALRMTPEKFGELVGLVGKVLPCPECSLHTEEYLRKEPPGGDLFAWSIRFHSASQKGGRAIDSGELEFWRGFYQAVEKKSD